MTYDRIILICTVLIAVIYLVASQQIPTLEIGDPLGPKAFPRLLGVALLLAAGLFGFELWKDRGKKEEKTAPVFDRQVMPVLAAVVAWTAVYYFVFNELGFVVATSVFLLPLMAYFNRGKWIANVASAIGFSALIYWLFVKLDVNLPSGILPF
jgi:putative tricarboxylic transport membrane protein